MGPSLANEVASELKLPLQKVLSEIWGISEFLIAIQNLNQEFEGKGAGTFHGSFDKVCWIATNICLCKNLDGSIIVFIIYCNTIMAKTYICLPVLQSDIIMSIKYAKINNAHDELDVRWGV